MTPFVPAPILGSSCWDLLGEAGVCSPACPLVYHLAQLWFELGHLRIFQRGFPQEEEALAREHVLLPSTPEIQAWGLTTLPAAGVTALSVQCRAVEDVVLTHFSYSCMIPSSILADGIILLKSSPAPDYLSAAQD